jgi:proteasome activator-like protein
MTIDPAAPGTPSQSGGEPDVVQAVPVEDRASAPNAEAPQEAGQESITEPAKLLRIASMVRELLDETRQASLDEAGRRRLADVYHRAVGELSEVLSGDLKDELAGLAPPLEGVPTESEIRVAQAQLVGWLEGLFHGIQAAMFAQQAAARAQFEELRRRGLPGQATAGPDGQPEGPSARGGQYL